MKKLLLAVVAIALAAGAYVAWDRYRGAGESVEYRTARVERGNVVATVTASGTLAAVVQVSVSSQISGQIREVLVDYNARVQTGQVLARLDPESIEQRVRQAQADVDAAAAQVLVAQATVASRQAEASRVTVNLDEARRDLERKAQLVERNFISPVERDRAAVLVRGLEQELRTAQAQVELARSQVKNAEANVRQRQAQLASARVDLGRTIIRAPVDGVIIKRSVEPGQTVAASLQAPELFVIAQDLRDMQVEVSVDEAEIGRIAVGQKASFTVDAFPGRNYEGTVRQVRMAATNLQNVISYTVVVSAANDTLQLFPGMTANVRIVTDTRENVLRVPNAALRFRPPGAPDPGQATGPSAGNAAGGATGTTAGGTAGGTANGAAAGGTAADRMRAFRDRLVRELALTETQQAQLDGIYAGMRERFMAARSASEEERPKVLARARAELSARINDIIDESQKQRYARILVEVSGRTVTRGTVWTTDAQGQPQSVELLLGLSDGSATEVLRVARGSLAEGEPVLIGTVRSGTGARPASRSPF